MNLKDLMSGIGVVIDDAFRETTIGQHDAGAGANRIFQIVEQIEKEWCLPFYKTDTMPSRDMWPGLLRAASFVLLDWRLWPTGAPQLERAGIDMNLEFIGTAKDHFVPVFIFTDENPEDVVDKLPEEIYNPETPEKSFIFLRRKADLVTDDALSFNDIEEWVRRNASVYALKTWERQFHVAKEELFRTYLKIESWIDLSYSCRDGQADRRAMGTN